MEPQRLVEGIGERYQPVLLAFAFVPFKSRPGRRIGMPVVVALLELTMVVLAVSFFIEMAASRQVMILAK